MPIRLDEAQGLRQILTVALFLGIDGGGTRTRAFAMDSEGQRGGWGEAGPSNPNHVALAELHANVRTAGASACERLGGSLGDCTSVFAGIAGITTASGRESMLQTLMGCGLDRARIGVDHDIRIALAGGLGGLPGIALIVGTGSSCYGRTADGRTWQTGGWEALISDEGSGFYLGREAILAAARMADGRQPESPLRQMVFDWLRIEHIAEVLPRLHGQRLARSHIAELAPRLIELAAGGDGPALNILDRGAFLLAELVAANHRQLPTGPYPDVVITGGVGTAKTIYREKIDQAIRRELAMVRIHEPLLPPALGAALLALIQTGQEVTAQRLAALKRFST